MGMFWIEYLKYSWGSDSSEMWDTTVELEFERFLIGVVGGVRLTTGAAVGAFDGWFWFGISMLKI